MIRDCVCPNPYQDQLYGRYRRVMNERPSPAPPRCSSCGKEVAGVTKTITTKPQKQAKAPAKKK